MRAFNDAILVIDETFASLAAEMKKFLKTSMQTDMIDKVNLDELKNAIMGVSIIKSRVKQREDLTKIMHYGLRPVIIKDQISK